MATRHALTPADLGPRSSLLLQKHAEYIASFSNIWEVWLGRPRQKHTRTQSASFNQHSSLCAHTRATGCRQAGACCNRALLDERHVLGPHCHGPHGAARPNGLSQDFGLGEGSTVAAAAAVAGARRRQLGAVSSVGAAALLLAPCTSTADKHTAQHPQPAASSCG